MSDIAKNIRSKLSAASYIIENLPEYPGYNGSAFVIDEIEKDRIVKDLDESIAFIESAQAQAGQPIAAVTGWYDGRCVIEPLDRALAIPVGMALYSQPQSIPDCHGIANGKRTEDMSNKELRYHMQELSAMCYRQADEIEALKAQAGDGEAVGEVYFDAHDCGQVHWFEHPQEGALLYTAPPAAVNQQLPDGYVLVPIEPTIEMIAALAFNGDVDMCIGHAAISESVIKVYKAAIAAAQENNK